MEIQGKIFEIGAVQQVSEKFSKRDIVIEYAENPSYPEYVKFELTGDKVDIIDPYKVGDAVGIHFNLRGRPYTDKQGKTSYFNSLVIWRLTAGEAQPEMEAAGGIDDGQDLPF